MARLPQSGSPCDHMSKPSALRERILEAADRVARERGVANLTLDLVAEQAQVSKGGLLYHFTTKEALLAGMIDRSLDRYREFLRAAVEQNGEDYRGYLKASITARKDCDEGSECSRAFFAAAANFPQMPERAREDVRSHFDRLRSDPERFEGAALLSLAIDGLHFLELLQLSPLTSDERESLVKRLFELADKV
jgi:AcrR family transcriptional regulator